MPARSVLRAHGRGMPDLIGDLRVAAALELAEDHRVALALGQRLDGLEHRPEAVSALGHLVRAVGGGRQRLDVLVRPPVLPQRVQRRVVDDPVQPRPQVDAGVVAAQRGEGVEEGLLEDVLGPRRRQQPRAVAQERAVVAVDDRLERAVVPGAGEVDQPLVGLHAQQRPPGQPGRLDQQPRRQAACLGVTSNASMRTSPRTLRATLAAGSPTHITRGGRNRVMFDSPATQPFHTAAHPLHTLVPSVPFAVRPAA